MSLPNAQRAGRDGFRNTLLASEVRITLLQRIYSGVIGAG